jgi:hypothetical protein
MIDVDSLLEGLSATRPLFHSEADFQHAFAWAIHGKLPLASVRLELPIHADERDAHLDLWLAEGERSLAIELKYKTRGTTAIHHGESFRLKNHSAQDLGRYDFIKDIMRLEGFLRAAHAGAGWAIILTNDSLYWQAPARQAGIDAAFRLHDGHPLSGRLAWGPGASAGTTKNREAPLLLRGTYVPRWRDYSDIHGAKDSRFRYLAIPITMDGA